MLLKNTTENKPESKSTELLETYLANALKFIGRSSVTKGQAKAAAKGFSRPGTPEQDAYWGRPDISQISMKDVNMKQAQIKSELKKYGIKEKLNYAFNAQAYKEKNKDEKGLMVSDLMIFIAGMTVTAATFPKDAPATPEGMGVIALGAAASVGMVMVKKGFYKILDSKTEAGEKKVTEYRTLKHAQLALKQLKKQILVQRDGSYKEQVQKLFAAGIGNPGGVITSAVVQRKAGGRS